MFEDHKDEIKKVARELADLYPAMKKAKWTSVFGAHLRNLAVDFLRRNNLPYDLRQEAMSQIAKEFRRIILKKPHDI